MVEEVREVVSLLPSLFSPRCCEFDIRSIYLQAALAEAESAVEEATKASVTVLGDRSDSDDDENLVNKPAPSSSASGVSEVDLRPLEVVAKNARKAGSTVAQIEAMIEAAKADKIGENAEGAMDRLIEGSRDTLKKINKASMT